MSLVSPIRNRIYPLDVVSNLRLGKQDGSILFTVTPTPGHVNPMLAIACHLRDQGHSIIFNTSEVFQKEVESEGIRFEPLMGKANFDYRVFNKFLPEGQILTPGTDELIYDSQHVFGDTMLPQCDGIREILSRDPVDLIVTDSVFLDDWRPVRSRSEEQREDATLCQELT